MSIETFVLCFIASLIFVFMKAVQQLNVQHTLYQWVMPCSIGMGVTEVAILLLIVKADTLAIGVTNGLGSGLGAMAAMWLHGRVRGRSLKTNQ